MGDANKMVTKISRHFDDDTLELYAMGRLPETEVPELEEHLLVCSGCQFRLEQAADFVSITKAAIDEIRTEERAAERKSTHFSWLFGTPKPIWAGAFAALALAVVIPILNTSSNNGPVSEVELRASRGLGEQVQAHAASGRVAVVADVSELPQMASYLVSVVDQKGHEIWKGGIQPVDHKVRELLPNRVASGTYWIRIFTPDGSDLLREYSLQIQ